jgi:tetratricopeptide (TPR) repeat protein
MAIRKTVGWLVFAALMAVLVPTVIGYSFCVVGSKFYADGNYQAALKVFKAAVFINPRLARGYVELGSTYLAMQDYEKAEQSLLKARSIDDDSCAACGLGMTYHALKRDNDAEKEFNRAIRLNPSDVCAYNQSARMYYDQDKYQKAIGPLKQVVALKPNSSNAHLYLGNAYGFSREYESAVESYKEAIRLDPRNVRAHLQLGIAYGYMRRYEEAVAAFKEALKVSPNDEETHYALALAYLSLRNRKAAFAEYEILRKLNPDKAAELFADASLPRDRKDGQEKLYFIPVGNFSAGSLNKLVTYYQHKLGVNAICKRPMALALPAIDKRRQQVIAEEVLELMKRSYPELAADPNAILIALTEQDMYIRERNWQFAFSYWTDKRFAVVSSARMNPVNLGEAANSDLLEARMRKMVMKNIGMLYYLLPSNQDPTSVLYDDINGVEDLDNMSEDF